MPFSRRAGDGGSRPFGAVVLWLGLCPALVAQEPDAAPLTESELAAEIEHRLRSAIERMSRVRRLPIPGGPIRFLRLGGKGLVTRLQDRSFEDRDRGDLARRNAFLHRLGLAPVDLSLEEAYDRLPLTPGGVSYDAAHDVFVVTADFRQWYFPAADHEIVHFLEDRYLESLDRPFSIDLEYSRREGQDDALLAFQCLVEGTAAVATVEAMLQTQGMTLADYEAYAAREDLDADLGAIARRRALSKPVEMAQREAPGPFLDALLDAPASCGATFVQRLRRDMDWPAIDARVYGETGPPRSMEQVLHPEKYLAGELPEKVELPSLDAIAPPAEWIPLGESTAGEFTLRILTSSEDAAAGWAGDRYRVFRNANAREEILLVWLIRFDSAEEAREASEALPVGHPHSLVAEARSVCIVSGPATLVTPEFLSRACELVVR